MHRMNHALVVAKAAKRELPAADPFGLAVN